MSNKRLHQNTMSDIKFEIVLLGKKIKYYNFVKPCLNLIFASIMKEFLSRLHLIHANV